MNFAHIALTLSLTQSPSIEQVCTDEAPALRACKNSPVCASCSVWGPPWGVDCSFSILGYGCSGFCGTGAGLGCTGSCG